MTYPERLRLLIIVNVVKLTTDTGLDSSDKITKDGALTVTSQNGTTVEYSINGTDWSLTQPTAKEGENIIQVRAKELSGNVSEVTIFTFTLDTTVSNLSPVITKAIDNIPTIENILTNGTSNDNTLELVGTLTATLASDEKLMIVEIIGQTQTILGEATVTTVDGNTTWSYTTSALSNGIHNFVAVKKNRYHIGTQFHIVYSDGIRKSRRTCAELRALESISVRSGI